MTPILILCIDTMHSHIYIYLSINFVQLYTRGFRVRGLAHPGHWATPVGALFERYANPSLYIASCNIIKVGSHFEAYARSH